MFRVCVYVKSYSWSFFVLVKWKCFDIVGSLVWSLGLVVGFFYLENVSC